MSFFHLLERFRTSSAAIPALLATLTALLFWRLTFLGEALYWGTPLLQFYPWRTLAVEEYLSGRIPLWNPYAGFGAPLAANFQSGVFYPLNFFYFFLPIALAMTATVVLHVFLAGVFTYGYGRALRLSRSGALAAGLTFMFSGYVVARAGFLSITSAVAWLPALLWCIEGSAQCWTGNERRGWALWAAGQAGAVGMLLLAGHIQMGYYSLLAGGAYLLFRSLWTARPSVVGEDAPGPRRWLHAARVMLSGMLAVALGVALAAIQLLPGWELAAQSIRRTGAEYQYATGYSLFPGQLVGALTPNFFGSQASGDWWGPGAAWEGAIYVGVLPLLLAVVGLRYHRSCVRWFFLVLGLVALFLATGRHNPVFALLFEWFPGLALFQAPARFTLWYTLAVAVLAGLGWDVLRARELATGTRLGGHAAAGGIAMVLTSMALTATGLARSLAASSVAAVGTGGFWLAAAGLVVVLRRRLPGGVWRAGVLGFIVADLFFFGMPLNPTTDARLYAEPSPETLAALRSVAGLSRTYVTETDYQESLNRFFDFHRFSPKGLKDLWQMREALAPNLATAERLYETYNYDPLHLARAHRLQETAEALGLPDRLLDIMGVRFLVTYQRNQEGWKVWGESGPVTVYEREPGLPRAFIVPEAIRVSGEGAALARVASSDFDPRSQVVLEAPAQLSLPSGHTSGEVKIVDYGPQRVSLEVESAGGVLVLADAYYPGWNARVDTAQVPVWPANAAFRGIIMPAGAHQVEFWYEPATFQIGASISTLALLTVMLLAGYGFWSLRRAG